MHPMYVIFNTCVNQRPNPVYVGLLIGPCHVYTLSLRPALSLVFPERYRVYYTLSDAAPLPLFLLVCGRLQGTGIAYNNLLWHI